MRRLRITLLASAALACAGLATASQPTDVSSIRNLYPIPTRDALNVVARGDPHGYSIRIVQMDGRVMRRTHFSPSDGQYHTIALNTAGLRSGFYAVVYASDLSGGAVVVRRFLILR